MNSVLKVTGTWSEIWQSMGFGLCNVNNSFKRKDWNEINASVLITVGDFLSSPYETNLGGGSGVNSSSFSENHLTNFWSFVKLSWLVKVYPPMPILLSEHRVDALKRLLLSRMSLFFCFSGTYLCLDGLLYMYFQTPERVKAHGQQLCSMEEANHFPASPSTCNTLIKVN